MPIDRESAAYEEAKAKLDEELAKHVSKIDGGPKIIQVLMHSVLRDELNDWLQDRFLTTVQVTEEDISNLETWVVVPPQEVEM